MNEILEIEVDGEVEDRHRSERTGRAPTWGLPAAVAVAGALVLAVLITVVLPGFTTDGRRAPAATDPPTAGPAPEAQAPLQDQGVAPQDPVGAAEDALDAWARFAVTGELTLLDGTFDPNGPQYRLLQAEAENLSVSTAGGSYLVELYYVSVNRSAPSEAVVGAKVKWTRSGEADQSFDWDLVLRRGSEDRWLLWTVA